MSNNTVSTEDTFVIGDVHGHLDRLEALLKQEGLLDDKGQRLRPEVEVVQLGDLCHLGVNTADEDQQTLETAPAWLDVILWGNHDYAIVSSRHHFGGYRFLYGSGPSVAKSWYQDQYHDLEKQQGKLRFAHAAHGYLLTHAGLHPKFLDKPMTAKQCAAYLNKKPQDEGKLPVLDSISFARNGSHFCGGILWRDQDEDLAEVPQIFGHSAYPYTVRTYKTPKKASYCIDVGDVNNGRLAGIWLPSQRVAEVDLNAV